MPTFEGMHAGPPPALRRFAGVDLAGLACFVVTMWALAVLVRGAVLAACPGCDGSRSGRALVITATLILLCVAIVAHARGIPTAAAILVVPGLIASTGLVLWPGVPLHLLGLTAIPWSLAAVKGAVRLSRPGEITAAIWTFGLIAVVGASASGIGAVTAAGAIVVCALAAPASTVFHMPRVPDVVPDDLI